MADETTWKRRFLLFMGARLLGLAILFTGIAVMFTGMLRPGGWPAVGIILAAAGLAALVALPRMLKNQWSREDSEA